MVQDQLVEYISSQLKAGISRDTIKSTLTAAGWQATDVEDTLKKVEATNTSQPITASPAAAAATIGAASAASSSSAKPLGPQTIKMSDLISTSDPAASASVGKVTTTTSTTSQKVFTGSSPVQTKAGATSYTAPGFSEKPHSSHGALIIEIILGVLVVGIGAFAGYLYFQNSALNSQVSSANNSDGANSQKIAALQQSINASTTAWNTQLATLTGNSKELQTELSFYAVPPSASSGATTTATVSGTLSGGGKLPYLITATYGAKIYISNSKDASATVELAPLEASDTTASFTGTYVFGADSITLTAVNGTNL